jgi:hypothetical protein
MKTSTLWTATAAAVLAVPVLLSPVTTEFLSRVIKTGAANNAALAGKTAEPVRPVANSNAAAQKNERVQLETYQPKP